MDSKRSTNVLLAIIAICLILIVMKMYDGSLVAEAQAQAPSTPTPAILGCYMPPGASSCQWRHIRVDSGGRLMTQ